MIRLTVGTMSKDSTKETGHALRLPSTAASGATVDVG
jgi:hypothetical protein